MLDSQQKAAYIRAGRCLQHLPAKNTTTAIMAHYDELQALHINLADTIHTVVSLSFGLIASRSSDTEDSQSQGHFLPWHRQFTVVREMLLRDECQYIGPIP
jgi:tyrosinase